MIFKKKCHHKGNTTEIISLLTTEHRPTDLQTNNQQFFTLFHWQPGRDKRNPHLTISPSYRKSKLFKIWVGSNVPARFYFVSLHQLILLLCQARIIHWSPNFDTKLIVAWSVSIGELLKLRPSQKKLWLWLVEKDVMGITNFIIKYILFLRVPPIFLPIPVVILLYLVKTRNSPISKFLQSYNL